MRLPLQICESLPFGLEGDCDCFNNPCLWCLLFSLFIVRSQEWLDAFTRCKLLLPSSGVLRAWSSIAQEKITDHYIVRSHDLTHFIDAIQDSVMYCIIVTFVVVKSPGSITSPPSLNAFYKSCYMIGQKTHREFSPEILRDYLREQRVHARHQRK